MRVIIVGGSGALDEHVSFVSERKLSFSLYNRRTKTASLLLTTAAKVMFLSLLLSLLLLSSEAKR